MKLGLGLDIWAGAGLQMPVAQVREAERLGFDSVWTAEAYGADAITPLAFLAGKTSRIRLGTAIVQISARTATATAMAREAHERQGLAVVHQTAPAEDLDLPDESFDIAYLADTLEITPDPDRVIEQAARVLKPDAVLIYDTVNRTLLSRLIYLGAFQALPITRIVPPGRYAAVRLRTPAEVVALLDAETKPLIMMLPFSDTTGCP